MRKVVILNSPVKKIAEDQVSVLTPNHLHITPTHHQHKPKTMAPVNQEGSGTGNGSTQAANGARRVEGREPTTTQAGIGANQVTGRRGQVIPRV
jgi:hypothetical protein